MKYLSRGGTFFFRQSIVKLCTYTMEYFKNFHELDVQPSAWMNPNRVYFLNWVKDNFKYLKTGQDANFIHQKLIKDYIQYDSPYRGLLLYHGLGVGKTR